MNDKSLVRREEDRLFLGVSAGIARYLNIDPVLVRIAFAAGIVLSFGKAALIYFVLALFMPKQDTASAKFNGFSEEEVIIHKSA